MPALLEIDALESGYGKTTVLHGIGLAVADGERLGLFGPNGHGKTTLLNAISKLIPHRAGSVDFMGEPVGGISGLLKPTRGSIRCGGEDIGGMEPRRIVAKGLIHVAQANQLFPELTVAENLALAAYGRGTTASEAATLARIEALFPRLAERRGQTCRTLSGGERQMVAIGVGLMGAPRLLMLDEPTLGLSPRLKDELCEAILKIAADGLPLLVVEQDVEFLASVTDRLVMLEHGQTGIEVSSGDGLDHDRIMDLYFGRHGQ